MKRVLSNNRGSGFPLAVAITLCLVMIFTGISEYFRLMIVAQGVRDALQSAVISNMTLLSAALLIPHPMQISMAGFWYNMTAVTLGNIVGGAFFVGMAYWYISKNKNTD